MTDGKKRCRWAASVDEGYTRYHDEEWGVAVYDDEKLYEMLLLECFQAGLSWNTILKKRENFRRAFDGFDAEKIAAYGEKDIERLMGDSSIVRCRRKIEAAIKNAGVFLSIQQEYGSFAKYLWGFTGGCVIYNEDDELPVKSELSDRVSLDLKKRGMGYVGSVTVYSYLQAVGIICDHELYCFRYKELRI